MFLVEFAGADAGAARVAESLFSMTLAATPVAGQLVTVRNHRYVVTAIHSESIGEAPVQSLVSLSSVEDDALGEELRVIWDLEPGAAILERASMPELSGFDEPARLDAFLNAVRWGAVSQADTNTLQAPFRSGIEDYQLDPLARVITMPGLDMFAYMNSSFIQAWVWNFSSTMKTDLNFSPSDCIDPLPLPIQLTENLVELGRRLETIRKEIMAENASGLTKLYNNFHSQGCFANSIATMRDIQVEIDSAVLEAYGWKDVAMNHGFHALSHLPESDRIRFTICESARTEVLGRLARLNRERWLAEQVEEISFSEKASALRGTRAKAKLTMVQGGLL